MKRAVAALAASVLLVLPALASGTHPRPKGASPVRASLVPAYEQCTAPDRTHGAPLAFPSCSGPQQVSDLDLTDVGCQGTSAGCTGPGEDYAGSLEARITIQMTDHDNAGDPATVQPFSFTFEVPCGTTADTTVGSTCSIHIPFSELVGVWVADDQRTVWELDRLQLWDGGADGDGLTPGDNTLFAIQGIFIP